MHKISGKYCSICVYTVLSLATFVVFWQLSTHEFICYDDPEYVTENRHILSGLKRENVVWAFTAGHASNWHPLTWLSHMLDCQLFGTDAGWHHLTNLLFHIANTLLLFGILRSMTGAIWSSGFVAILFALHPLHIESVAWITERKDVLSAFFWMLTMAGYLRYVKRPSIGRYLLTVVLFALGLMAKPMVVTLPFVLLLLDYWPLERFQGNRKVFYRLVLEKVPFFILSAISSVVTFIIQRSAGAVAKVDTLSLNIRIGNAFVSYVKYIGKMIWPGRLAVFYPYQVEVNLLWQTAVAALLLLVVSVFVIRLARRHRYLAVGWFWYLGTLVPVIGFVQVGSQSMADRYTYLPLTGLFIIIGWGLPELLAKWRYRKIFLPILALAAVLAFSICSWFQVRYWRDSVTLFEHSLEVTGGNSVVYNNLGNAFRLQGKFDEAIYYYHKVLRVKPDHASAHNNLGIALSGQGNLDEAISHYNQAIQLNPGYAEAYYNLGLVLKSQGKLDDTIDYLRKALEFEPNYAEAHINLGIATAIQGKFDESMEHFQKALQLAPDNAKVHYNLGLLFQAQGRFDEAVSQFIQALEIEPDYTKARHALETLLNNAK